MKRFWCLLKKDLEAMRWPVGIFAGVMTGIMVFVRFRVVGGLPGEIVPALTVALPLGVLPFWLLWQSLQSLRSEWQEDTVYTLLSLPVPGWWITLSKLFRIWIEYTLILALVVVGNMLLFSDVFRLALGDIPGSWIFRNGFLLYLFSLAVIAVFVILIQLVFVVSKLVGRFQGLVALWTGILTLWVMGAVTRLLEPLFRWVPPLSLERLFRVGEIQRMIPMDLFFSPRVEAWLTVAAIFILTAYLLEHFVEIDG